MKLLLLTLALCASSPLYSATKKELKRDLRHLREYVTALEEQIDAMQLILIDMEEERLRLILKEPPVSTPEIEMTIKEPICLLQ